MTPHFVYFLSYTNPEERSGSLIGQAPSRRHTDRCLARQSPRNHRRNVLRCVSQCDISPDPQAALQFNSGRESFRTEGAAVTHYCQWPAQTKGISEFPPASIKILLADQVFSQIPLSN